MDTTRYTWRSLILLLAAASLVGPPISAETMQAAAANH